MRLSECLRNIGSVLLVVAAASGCSDQPATGTEAVTLAPAPLAAAHLAVALEKADVPGSLKGTHWLAEVHADAMQEVLANGAALKAASPAARCAFVATIVRKRFDVIRTRSGATVASMEAMLATGLERGGCNVAAPNSVFGRVTPLSAVTATGDSVTGAFAAYVPAIEAAAEGYGHPSGAESEIAAILLSASALPAPDYEVLSGIASMTVSDLYYWYSVQSSGGCGSCGGDPPMEEQFLMSVFGTGAPANLTATSLASCGFWCRAGWSDLAGGVGAVGLLMVQTGGLAGAAPQVVLGTFTGGAIIASGLYAISAF